MLRGIPRAAVENPVAVHLLSLLFLVAGIVSYLGMPREIFPEFTRNRILVTTLYPGASSEDVEELVSVKIEDAIDPVAEVETIESTSREGSSRVTADLRRGADVGRVLQEIDRAVSAIDDLPADAEEPVVDEVENQFPVITLSIYGDVSELALKDLIRPIQREMEAIRGVAFVRPTGLRDLEWHVEVDPEALLRYRLTIDDVASALSARNLNLPGGLIERGAKEVIVRTRGETETAEQIDEVVIRATPDGSSVRVGDVARVVRGFERARTFGRYDGKPALNLTALKDPEGNILEIAAAVRELSRDLELPPGVRSAVHTDLSVFLGARLETMKNNALSGFFLVMVSLCLLLHWRMALLVALGIPLAFLVTFVGMLALGLSINMMSLFALILILGMLVDDAIIVTENIFRRMELGESPATAAVNGTVEVARPVLATIITTISAFLPMLLTPGEMGEWMGQVPIVVSLCLLGSLIECFAILPCHVSEFARSAPPSDTRFHRFLPTYERWVRSALRHRYTLIAGTLGFSVVLVTLAAAQLQFVLFGEFESDTYFINFEVPTTSSIEETSERARAIEELVLDLPAEEIEACLTNVGIAAVDVNQANRGSYVGQVVYNLAPPSERERSAGEILRELRARTAELPGFTKIEFRGLQAGPGGPPIEVSLQGEDFADLRAASAEVQGWLRSQVGVVDVFDDFAPGKPELEVRVDVEAARAVGLSTGEVARQVRHAFHGREATTVRRKDEDVPLIVRFPPGARAYRDTLEQLWVTAPDGRKVPLSAVARPVEGRGLAQIVRGDRQRAITVLGDVNLAKANALEVTERLRARFAEELPDRYGVDLEIKGQRREAERSMRGLMQAFGVAVLLIYFILGTQFRSFGQPLFVMVAIPFGIDGLLVGHMILGEDLSFLSMMGLVATSGIVVNDSLVLVDLINRLRRDEGYSVIEAATIGSVRRLRPIIGTSTTTVLGLTPLAFFASGQAEFLSPMAISIVFGLAFATGLTLVVIPCLYVILEDVKGELYRGGLRLLGRDAALRE